MANGIGKKAELAQRMIVRYIWDSNLGAGDKLPSCQVLAEQLGLGNATVFRAVRELQKQGILESRDKVGVFVRDPRTPGLAGYNIGILTGKTHDSISYANMLACCVQSVLARNGGRGILFNGTAGLDSAGEDILSSHIGVRESIERGEIQGLIIELAMCRENWAYLKKHSIPCCYIGGFAYLEAPLSVTISLENTIRMAFDRIRGLGLKAPGLLLPKLDTEKSILKVCSENAKTIPGFHLKRNLWKNVNIENYQMVLDDILARPNPDRPDSIIFTDDVISQCFYAGLVRRNGTEYMPHPVILGMSRNLRDKIPLDADFLEYSFEGLAEAGVGLVLTSLREKKMLTESREIVPEKNFIQPNTKEK